MGMLIISCLGSLREMIKRKERRRKRSRKSRRRRCSFSRCFLFSPPSSFPLLCLKTLPAVSIIKKSAKLLQSLAKFCIFASVRNRKTFSMDSPSMPVGRARWQKRTNMTDIANQYGWYYRVKWLILVRTMAETMLQNSWCRTGTIPWVIHII